MSARPGGHSGAGDRPGGGGKPGGYLYTILTDENGALLTDENGALLTDEGFVVGTVGQGNGGQNGAQIRTGGKR